MLANELPMVHAGVAAPPRSRATPSIPGRWLLLLPGLLFIAVFLLYPASRLIGLSLYAPDFTLKNYSVLFMEPVYARVFWATFEVSALSTLFALVLGYPVAFAMANGSRFKASFVLVFVMLPLLTSILVRTYGWMVLLGRDGLINNGLMFLGVTTESLKLIYNRVGTVLGMTHVLMPFMIMPIYACMVAIDPALIKAGKSLGASEFAVLRKIYLPLTGPGVLAGVLLVFIMAIGFFVTPALLGGAQDLLVATLINVEVHEILNWGLASSLATVLLLATFVVLLVYQRFLGVDRLWRSAR